MQKNVKAANYVNETIEIAKYRIGLKRAQSTTDSIRICLLF